MSKKRTIDSFYKLIKDVVSEPETQTQTENQTNGDTIIEESPRARVEPETNTILNTDEVRLESLIRDPGSVLELLRLSVTFDPKKSFNADDICKLVTKYYPLDFTEQERIEFRLELQYFELNSDPKLKNVSSFLALCRGLQETEKSKMYPLIDRLIRLILTLPVSTARAFSKMKLVKTRLRSTMSDDFLKSSMILSIEREIVSTLCNEKIIDDFYSKSQRRVQMMKKPSFNNFQTNASLKSIYSCIKTATPSFKVDECMIWIEIRGLPLCAWGSNAYKKVADMFGKFMFFECEKPTKISSGRICISTKSHNIVSERVLVKVHGVNYDVHVHELGTWNINIVDETLDSSDNIDVNGMEKVEDYVDENLLSDLNDLNDLKETINELASNEIQHPISKENIDQEDDINNVSPEIGVSSDLSRPPGFKRIKRTSSKCSTSFAKYRKKDIKGVSLIEELSRIIEVDEALPDVRVTAIDRLWSNHNHILLHVSKYDFVPTPFKIFHSWLLRDSFDEVIKTEFFPLFANSSGLCALGRDSLETPVSLDEVKNAVWDCGSSKAPGPDRLSNGSKKKKKLLIFKVDFEKAFDSASVLINGSPTSEFSIKRGLRQGDPLSPFLFILVMEGLHNALSIAVSSGLIRGVKFGSPEVFYLASCLKINIQKSNVYGIGVSDVDVSSMANNSGCASGSFPFTYLGLHIGSNMSLTSSCQSRPNLRNRNSADLLDMLFEISSAEINEVEDTCVWSLGTDGTFSVKDARCIIDSKILPSLAPSTVWDKNIPRKVFSCPSCNGNVESSNHIFFECNIAKDIWMIVSKWCDISFPPFTSYEH
ncbi:RNA-directed DNA polymerase, eukaryota [Tanacetum coccineum]